MFQAILRLLFGSKYERDVKKMAPTVVKINSYEEEYQKLTDEQIKEKTIEFRNRVNSKKDTLDSILPEAFALVREASVRTLGLRHYDVQMMGGIVLHQGKIAEMKTGEGKTLTSTLAVYLNALTQKGCHLVTVNDYLAERDANWMRPVYEFLGLTVGFILSNMDHEERKAAYACDITYGTNNEYGFDYLRDNMVEHISLKVQRGHNYCIVDEVDSVLIDEARTPLIISGPSEENIDIYPVVNKIIPRLKDKDDYEIDEKARSVVLTEMGVAKAEKLLGVENLYSPDNVDLVHHLHQALKAHVLFTRDKDYLVQNGEVMIVDEFTGRIMEGRRYSDGLHQALEAKEHVEIKQESQTLATITFQNYFRMYDKLSGMTGTADTEAEEFRKIYKLDVSVLPTHKPMIRKDYPDKIYRTEAEKFNAIVEDIKEAHIKGQPVLLGTVSVENSDKLSNALKRKGIPHSVLNAKYHEREAEIVLEAGQKGKVTIATNMAGRGTDIKLGEGVIEAGGLFIIGSERHESRRIDNQLRGRAGRQGDPGASRFYLCLDDDLMRIFGSDKIAPLMQKIGMQEGEAIEHKMVSKAIERAQKRVEGHNFDIRKHLLEYDDVMNKQRTYIYEIRNQILEDDNIKELILKYIDDVASNAIKNYLPGKHYAEWHIDDFKGWLNAMDIEFDLSEENLSVLSADDIDKEIYTLLMKKYSQKREELGDETMNLLEKMVALQVIDQKWKDHLYEIDQIKEGIWTLSYAEKNPLVEYRFKSFELFGQMVEIVKDDTIEFLFKAQIDGQLEEDIPQEYQMIGDAIHDGVESYGVSAQSLFQEANINTSMTNRNKPKHDSSIAAKKTAGGSSKRKSTRRKKR